MIAVFSLDTLLFLIVFFVPLSVPLSELAPNLPIDLFLPTEPLLFGLLLIFIAKALLGQKFDRKILLHPVSIAIFFNLLWVFFTSVTSTMPIVSLKFFIARVWFLIGFYFLATQLFKKYQNIEKFLWLYIIAFLIVILYDTVNLSAYGFFDQKAAHSAMKPFYNDHTSYGAIISMFLFIVIYYASLRKQKFIGHKTVMWLLVGLFLFALVLSYSRAAWVSVLCGIVIWFIIKLRVKFRTILIIGAFLGIYLASFLPQILDRMEKNDQDSSKDLSEHVQSISNISTDASNVERLNRWACAIKMFKQKPIVGWGPGTYMFQYAPFQLSYNRTIISTNMGDWGNAHSEYIGPLAESGFLGPITFLIIIIYTIITAIKVYKNSENKQVRGLVLALLLGLCTYYIHGTLNNFLDTDKASAPFWGFTAIIVALDVYYKKENKEEIGL